MTRSRSVPAALPLILGLLALTLFLPGLKVMDATRAWGPTLYVALPALMLSAASLFTAVRLFKTRPTGAAYGWAATGGFAGGFALVFWMVMVPMLLIVALPARVADPAEPAIEESCSRMKVLARQVKTFHLEHGRLPVNLVELVDKGLIQSHLLYDPRQKRRDAPSYRLMVREMPPESEWADTPLLEGRIPDREGRRLIVYPNETCGTIRP